MNFENPALKIHCIGIGGIGLSALANLLRLKKHQIRGSNLTKNSQTEFLEQHDIKIFYQHKPKNLDLQTDLVIYSFAIPENNPELQTAKQLKIPVLSYPEAVGLFAKSYDLIAVAGTHGKTTSTGMLAKIMIEANLDPTVIIGSTTDFLEQQNFRLGQSNYLLIEACEYYAGFLHFHPKLTLITNLEHDHFDAYPTENSYLEAFEQLISQSQHTILNIDFPLAKTLLKRLKPQLSLETYSKTTNTQLTLQVPGEHNQTNAQGSLKIAQKLGIFNPEKHLATFTGTKRRLELITGPPNSTQYVYDDYGHHPTEIQAVFQAISHKHQTTNICLIYQPHQHNRSIALLPEFKEAFKLYKTVYIPNIYQARDTLDEQNSMTAEKFAQQTNSIFTNSLQETAKNFKKLTATHDIIIIMGAGDIGSSLLPTYKNYPTQYL